MNRLVHIEALRPRVSRVAALCACAAFAWMAAGCGSAQPRFGAIPGQPAPRESVAPDAGGQDAPPALLAYSIVKSANQKPRTDPNEDIREAIINRSAQSNPAAGDRIGLDAREMLADLAVDTTFDAGDDDDISSVFQRLKQRSVNNGAPKVDEEINPAVNRIEMVKEIVSVMEIAYLWGGTNAMHGLDCSAFVGTVYSRAFGVHLPRTSNAQFQTGSRIKRAELRIGDLVFFSIDKSRGPVSHVGIYVGEGLFAHAGARGITVADLDRPLYRHTYAGARRILKR